MRSARAPVYIVAWLTCFPFLVWSLNVSTSAAIKSSAAIIAQGVLTYYPPDSTSLSGQPIGIFGPGYTWGEAGAVWGALVHYFALTGDNQFNGRVQAALTAQSGLPTSAAFFLPANQSSTEGNFDQSLWALACMSAAEQSFPGDIDGTPYLRAAQNVFSQQVSRWTLDSSSCGGGLRSLISSSSPNQTAYTAKDSLSVGAFFQLAARLAIQTQNSTYTQWAQTAYAWATSNGLVNEGIWAVYANTNTSTNCSVSSINAAQYSAASAAFLYGSSLMYNATYSQSWVARTQGFLSTLNNTFFQYSRVNQLTEPACQIPNACSPMQQAYLALAARWLAGAGNTAPFATAMIQQLLLESGMGMAAACTQAGVCTVEGTQGLGQELTALDSVLALLVGSGAGIASPTAGGNAGPSSKPNSASGGRVDEWRGGIVMALVVTWVLAMVL